MLAALGFLTLFGGARVPTRHALPWFGPVGALLGAAVGAVWWLAAQWLPLPVAGAIALIADLVLTGMLHVDGLADSADGLIAPLSTERRLAVMRDPRTGAFGVVAVVALLLLRFTALTSLPVEGATVLAFAAIWGTARMAMAVTACTVPYARSSGLATAFLGGPVLPVLALGVPPVLVLGALGAQPAARGLLAVAAAAIGAAVVVTFARGRIGGFTGDVLGAAGVVAETAALVLLTVRA